MRIAYMLTSLGIGGAERQVVALAERMAARGHSVLLIVLRERQPEQFLAGVEVVHLDMRKTPLSVFTGVMRARRLLRSFRPDLLHSHTYPANMAARLLRLSGGVPAVLSTIHNVYEGRWPRILSYRFTDFLTIHTTAVSGTAALRYIRLKAVPQRKCTVIQNAIDVAEFTPSQERRAEIRNQLEAGDSFVWLSAGRIVPSKDFPNLLQAFAEVRAAVPQAQLWIAGERPLEESKSLAVFGFAGKSAIMPNVRWLGVRRDMPALLDGADAFVLASAWEGMPLVIGEAMAMEKPVVATDVGGVRELAGDTALLVPSQHPAALAAAMLALMHTPAELRRTQGQIARQRIVTAFNMNARADEWDAFYRSLVTG